VGGAPSRLPRTRCLCTLGQVLDVVFTVEPFVVGNPGPHVLAAVEAVRERGVEVEFGPFGSSFAVAPEGVGAVVGALLDAAYANGATQVTVQVGGETL
jgi:uncharacterized protein YqgV (UPF0045/DUF77 family)